MAVNARGTFLGMKYALPQMAHGGAIVNIASVSGRRPDGIAHLTPAASRNKTFPETCSSSRAGIWKTSPLVSLCARKACIASGYLGFRWRSRHGRRRGRISPSTSSRGRRGRAGDVPRPGSGVRSGKPQRTR